MRIMKANTECEGVVKLYTTADCSGTSYDAPAGGCVTGSAAFQSGFVTCT